VLIDTHAHVQFNAFRNDADEVIKRALDAGVVMVAPSSQIDTSRRAIEYAQKYPGKIFAGVGLHPIQLKPAYFDPSGEGAPAFHTRVEEFDSAVYRELAEQSAVVAIGETGLDYVDRLHVSSKDQEKQERVFRSQIELAIEVGKPIVQHIRSGPVDGKERDAHEDALRIIAEYVPKSLRGAPNQSKARFGAAPHRPAEQGWCRGVAHCYSGNREQAQRYFDLGFFIGFTGLITFVFFWDEIIKNSPLERLLLETDCPYMTPAPHRGKRNEPSYVRFVAEKIAELKGVSFDDVARQTTENARKLFGLRDPPASA